MANLLDRSSLVLTPTAYNNGEALCIKPDDASGDFTFSRNSAATRVNAQGLVENVQILSSNLVQNGDFSEEGVQEVSNGSFSQEGAELVTNGDFSNGSTGWILDTGWSVSNEKLNAISVNSTSAITSSFPFVGNSFKVTYTISDYSQGEVRLFLGGVKQTLDRSENGTFTEYITITSGNTTLYVQGVNGFTGSIDNVSVREVAQDWTLGTGWSIGEDKATFDGVSNANLTQSNILTNGKQYKLTYEILENTTTSGYIRLGAETATAITQLDGAVGTHEMYFLNDGYTTSFVIRTNSLTGGDFSITNISVKEVGQNWALNDWSVGDSLASSGNTSSLLQQPTIYTNATGIYKTTFKAKSVNGTSVTLRLYDGSNIFETFTITSSDFQDFELTRQRAGINATLSIYNNSNAEIEITNISVIEITDDTNLPRINYEGFSYQDALGSELNPNTYIADKSANLTLNGTQLQIDNGGENYARARANVVLVSGKTYRAKVTCINQGTNGASFYVLSARPFGTINMISGETYEVTFVADSFYTPFYENKVGGSGLIVDNISIKEYLGQEVVPDSGCGSWLWEPQSTNLITYSEDFSQWIKTGTPTITSDYGVSPNGTQNGTRIEFGADERIRSNISASGDFTFSVYLKGSGVITLRDNTNVHRQNVTLTSEWARYDLSFNATITSVQIQNQTASIVDCEIWGAQVEQQTYATSYIPTSGSTNTRNQDLCTNGGSLASINSTEGVLYAEIAKQQDDNDSFILISLNNAASNSDANSVTIGFNNSTKFYLRVKSNGVISFIDQAIPSNKNQFHKVALKYKSGNISTFIDGVNVASSTTAFSFGAALDNLSFAYDGNNVLPFFGKTKALAVFPYLSDAELTELTTI